MVAHLILSAMSFRSQNRAMDRALSNRAIDISMDRSIDRPIERPMNRVMDRSMDRSMDQHTDRMVERLSHGVNYDIESMGEAPALRHPDRSPSGRLFVTFIFFSCCMCIFTVSAAFFVLPTDRLQLDRTPVVYRSPPHASTTLLRIMQLKTYDNDESRLDLSMLQASFPEWRLTPSHGEGNSEIKNSLHFDVDHVLSDLILAVRELARRNVS